MGGQTYSLGLDVGGTKCAVVLGRGEISADAGRFILDRIEFPTDQPRGWRAVMDEFFRCVDVILQRNGIKAEQLVGIGVSCGGPLNSRTGLVKCPPNLPDWDDVPVTAMLEERYGVSAYLQNDANACAVAEWRFGAGRGYDNLIFLTFGTGMGAGLILGGRLYTGANDMAGEVGHIRLKDDGPLGYGKNGSFEGFCSGGGIAKLAAIMLREHQKSGGETSLFENNLSAKTVAEAANLGDLLAMEIYRECARHLGLGLSILIDVINPQAIIIGSIFGRAHNLLEEEMFKTLKKEAIPLSLGACEISPAQLGDSIGDYAALGLAFNGKE